MKQLLPAGALAGLLFAALWASASVATKFGVQSVHPLILANVRFFIAGSGMLLFAYAIQRTKNAWPTGAEWRQLTIFALLNTTIYLGAFVLALKQVSAGIGSLSTATNPLFIALLSAVWLRRMPRWNEAGGLVLGLAGVGIATYPLLQTSYATVEGLLILLVGMVSVSAATVYYARIEWRLPSLVINGWQVLLGGLLLLPFTLLTAVLAPADFKSSQYDGRFLGVGVLVDSAGVGGGSAIVVLSGPSGPHPSLIVVVSLPHFLALPTRTCSWANPLRPTRPLVQHWSLLDYGWAGSRFTVYGFRWAGAHIAYAPAHRKP